MGDRRLKDLARAFAQNKLTKEAYRSKRAELLDSLVAEAAGQERTPPGQQQVRPWWLRWLALAVASLALISTLVWIWA